MAGPDEVDPGAPEEDDVHGPLEEVLGELREMPVGTRDPNIVGDAGPLDVPPGSDPPEGIEEIIELDES